MTDHIGGEAVRVLLVDNDPALLGELVERVGESGICVEVHDKFEPSSVVLRMGTEPSALRFDVVLLDAMDNGRDVATRILTAIRRTFGDQVGVVILTAHVEADLAFSYSRQGASGFFTKNTLMDKDGGMKLREVIFQAYNEASTTRRAVVAEDGTWPAYPEIRGRSPLLIPVFDRILRVAAMRPRAPKVLLLGATGTGKELFARAIHANSAMKEPDLIALNVGAFAEHGNVLEDELFGHDAQWPDALSPPKLGVFMQAAGYRWPGSLKVDHNVHLRDAEYDPDRWANTLFLDEIGDASPVVQTRLLHPIERRVIYPLGQTVPEGITVAGYRLICATCQPIEDRMSGQTDVRFREDLYARIAEVTIRIPTLAERGPEDIRLLATYFCEQAQEDFHSRSPKDYAGLSRGDMDLLCDHNWPRNVRELRAVVREAVILSDPRAGVIPLPPETRARFAARRSGARGSGPSTT